MTMSPLPDVIKSFTGFVAHSISPAASCEPELRTVDLDVPEFSPGDDVYYPRCVRVHRCGGCCGLGHLQQCLPTKVKLRDIFRVKIPKISPSPKPNDIGSDSSSSRLQLQVLTIEDHVECGCKCRIQPSHCFPVIHVYRADQCHCECQNESARKANCDQYGYKRWDADDCQCKCVVRQRCSRGMAFSHDTCRCEFQDLPIN